MKLNYVIAAWGGPRRSDDPRAQTDRTFFLRQHLATVVRLRHTVIDRITVVVPRCEDEPPEFTRFLDSLPSAVCTVLRRSNAGLSYGSWTEAYERTRHEFDGFIFVEDDYIFAVHDFDRALVDMAFGHGAGLVCGAVLPFGATLHPAIALGYVSTEALDKWAGYRPLPHRTDAAAAHWTAHGGYPSAERWQIAWGADFTALGISMVDWLGPYASPFWVHHGAIRWYGPRAAPPFVMPIQALGRWIVCHQPPDPSWEQMLMFEGL